MVPAALAIPSPCLCLITNRGLFPDGSQTERLREAVEGGVSMIQVREKDLTGGLLLAMVREIMDAVGRRTLVIVNERLDVALAAGAHGVHLGESALPLADGRRIAGSRMLVGRSVHNPELAAEAQEEGADYLIVGTLYPTRSHEGREPEGLEVLRRIAASVRLPLLGIGGITPGNVGDVMRSGATGAAVITSVLAAPDPRDAARRMLAAMRLALAAGGPERR